MLYAIYQFLTGRTDAAGALLGVCRIPVNFGVEIGHLWFVYMLLGLYLFAPVVSPWIETASRRAMEGYLALWAFTLCIPYVHLVFPELLGECFWNDTPSSTTFRVPSATCAGRLFAPLPRRAARMA